MTVTPGAQPPGNVSGGTLPPLKAAILDASGRVSCPDHPNAEVNKRGSRYRCSWDHRLEAPT